MTCDVRNFPMRPKRPIPLTSLPPDPRALASQEIDLSKSNACQQPRTELLVLRKEGFTKQGPYFRNPFLAAQSDIYPMFPE